MIELLSPFLRSDNPVVVLFAIIVAALSAAVVYQWRYTTKNTVPKWAWDDLVKKTETMVGLQSELLTVVKERLKIKK